VARHHREHVLYALVCERAALRAGAASFYLRGLVWRDDTPETDYGRYRRHDTKIDLSGEYRVTRWASVFFQGRDIFNVGQTWMETPPGAFEGQGAALRRYESYGAHWNFGVKGSF